MLPSAQLRLVLADLDALHTTNGISPQQQNYYGKLALIELCGWIEQSMDQMARTYCIGIRDTDELEKTLKPIYGFEYKHLRRILLLVAGISKVVEIEHSLKNNGASYQILNVQLGTLTRKRNSAAHTHMPGVQVTYDAPSSIIVELNQIEPALQELEKELMLVR